MHIFLEVMCTKMNICLNRGKGEGNKEKKVATSSNIFFIYAGSTYWIGLQTQKYRKIYRK